jgi:hypothetical protein
VRIVFSGSKENVPADGVSLRLNGLRGLGGAPAGMDTYATQACA